MAQPCPDDDHRSGPLALPLLTKGRGGRQGLVCRYRCGNACAHDAPNTSGNEYLTRG